MMDTTRATDTPFVMSTIDYVDDATSEPPWVFDNYSQRLFVAASLILITVFGLIGNIGTIVAVCLSMKLQTTANAFVVNLSVASSLACATLPFTVANMIHNQETSILPDGLCGFAGVMSYIGFSGTIVAHLLIAIDRVVRITRPNHQYHMIFGRRTVVLMICAAWFYANLSIILGLITHVRYGYSQTYRVCLPDINDANAATVSLFRATTIDVFILICVLICYTVIFVYIYRHNKRLLKMHRHSHRSVQLSERETSGSDGIPPDINGLTPIGNGRNVDEVVSKDGTPILLSANSLSLPDADYCYQNPSMIDDGIRTTAPAESEQHLSADEMSSETSSVSGGLDDEAPGRSVSSDANDRDEPTRQSSTPNAQNIRLRSQLTARQVKITMNMFLVVAVFIVCITPYITCLVIESLEQIFPYVAVFYALSNAINPVIYAWKHPQFRRVIKPMFCCRCSEIPEPTGVVKALRDYQRRKANR